MVVAQWSLVEGSMAEHYGLSLHDLFNMSWRRFRVLYEHLFVAGHLTRKSRDDQPDSSGYRSQNRSSKFNPIKDWNTLVGKSQPDRSRTLSFDEFVESFGVERKIVG